MRATRSSTRAVLLTSLSVGIFGLGIGLAQASVSTDAPEPPTMVERLKGFLGKHVPRLLSAHMAPPAPTVEAPEPWTRLGHAQGLTSEDRAHGFNECMMPDPGFINGYSHYLPIPKGQIIVPLSGGHTEDMGYDVVLHFHGHDPARKVIVQAARGVAFASMDLGIGSGWYEKAFVGHDLFREERAAIVEQLQKISGDPRAHIRHLALSAWSAGYGAILSILRYEGDKDIDAVILLDGMHAELLPDQTGEGVREVNLAYIEPFVKFAARAARGEKFFYFSHSEIATTYASTTETARALLDQLHLDYVQVDEVQTPEDRFALWGLVDVKGFHLRARRGNDERAHCQHLQYLDEAVGDLLEREWKTPEHD